MEKRSGISSTFGFRVKKPPMVPGSAPVLSAIRSDSSETGVMGCDSSIPSPAARLATGSASMAMTFVSLFSAAIALAIKDVIVVFPTPPLPPTASFKLKIQAPKN